MLGRSVRSHSELGEVYEVGDVSEMGEVAEGIFNPPQENREISCMSYSMGMWPPSKKRRGLKVELVYMSTYYGNF